MKIRALKSFAGAACMAAGDEREVSEEIGEDLVRAGYAVPLKTGKATKKATKDTSPSAT